MKTRNAGGGIARFAATVSAVIAVCGAFSACGQLEKETGYAEGRYEVTQAFTDIALNADGGVNVRLVYGEEYSITYTESNQEKFFFSLNGSSLIIEEQRTVDSLVGYKGKDLFITVPHENKINSFTADVNGAVDFYSEGGEADSFSFDVDGGAKIRLQDVALNRLTIDCDGALNATLVGSSDVFTLICDGAVNLNGKDFSTETANFEVDGAFNFDIACAKQLTVDCDGLCSGEYYGDAALVRRGDGVGNIAQKKKTD